MPRQPSPAARFGTRFHAWVEARFGQQSLLDPDDLPGRGDLGIDDEDDLRELITRFEAGPFGERVPHAVEAPFALVLAGQVVRGRMDAVYAEPDGRLAGRRLEDQPPRRPPTRSSWRSTGWPGPSCSGCRSTRSRPASTTCARGRPCCRRTFPTALP